MNHLALAIPLLLYFTTSAAFQKFDCVQKVEIPPTFKGDKVEKLAKFAKTLFPTYMDYKKYVEAKNDDDDHNYEVFSYAIYSLAGFDGTYKMTCYSCCFKVRSLPEEGENSPVVVGCSTGRFGCNLDKKKIISVCYGNLCNKEGNEQPDSQMPSYIFDEHSKTGFKLIDAVNETLFFDSVYNG